MSNEKPIIVKKCGYAEPCFEKRTECSEKEKMMCKHLIENLGKYFGVHTCEKTNQIVVTYKTPSERIIAKNLKKAIEG